MNKIGVTPEINNLVLALRAYNHKLRQNMLNTIAEAEKEKMTVTDLYIKLRLEQSVASQHLAILRRADLVRTETHGKFIYYKVNKTSVSQLQNLAEHWDSNTSPQYSRPVVKIDATWEATDALRKELFRGEPVGAV
jgi:ArsR family transcriptional regulator, virulence genes transcriptional regulator